jgi:hypothetical protein
MKEFKVINLKYISSQFVELRGILLLRVAWRIAIGNGQNIARCPWPIVNC